ncbi:MAG: 4-alpha-glucanotransferase, partial [Pirellulales bacterium]
AIECEIPNSLPLGWHQLTATLNNENQSSQFSCALVVTPERLPVTSQSTWGLTTQLYATRSKTSWGLGDFHDLATLASWGGHHGAGFLLINPIHAAEVRAPLAPSPYLPTSRRFFNPIYLHIEDIPEYTLLSESDRKKIHAYATPLQERASTDSLIDRDAIWEAKKQCLEIILAQPLSDSRQAAYEAYRQREDAELTLFATWCAFSEAWGIHTCNWPDGLHHPEDSNVATFQHEFRNRIQFFSKLQWLIDEQLSFAQKASQSAGMGAGIMHDLAVGVHPEGADAWMLQDVLAHDISVGAPPDMYNQLGQDWSQPPWRPDVLEAVAYKPYREMLRSILRHAGGIRIDHAIGLFRRWWIPHSMSAAEGTFVTYDHEALIGILVLEAQRAGASVIGEDLGTFDAWSQAYLNERGIAGTSVLWFEGEHGNPRPPEQWRENCLATVTVHDLPPTAGLLVGEHVRLRQALGLLTVDAETEWTKHWDWLVAWETILRQRGLIDPSVGRATDFPQEIIEGLYRLLAQSPCRFLAIALTDLYGDIRAQNQPGTFQEYPNWQIPMCYTDGKPFMIEDLWQNEHIQQRCQKLFGCIQKSSMTSTPSEGE